MGDSNPYVVPGELFVALMLQSAQLLDRETPGCTKLAVAAETGDAYALDGDRVVPIATGIPPALGAVLQQVILSPGAALMTATKGDLLKAGAHAMLVIDVRRIGIVIGLVGGPLDKPMMLGSLQVPAPPPGQAH